MLVLGFDFELFNAKKSINLLTDGIYCVECLLVGMCLIFNFANSKLTKQDQKVFLCKNFSCERYICLFCLFCVVQIWLAFCKINISE